MITIHGDGSVTGGTGGLGLRSPGSVIQTLHTQKTDTFVSDASTWTDITGLSQAIL